MKKNRLFARSLRPRRSLAIIASIALALGAASEAAASVEQSFYVSPTGSGTACTSALPCSLSTAQSAVRGLTAGMTGDLVVDFEAGTYPMSSPLTLTSADSGQNGHRVVYQADPALNPGDVTISAGVGITGWTLHDASLNIYQANVPAGFDTRQLYVNGVRATVARASSSSVFGTLTKTSTGYTYTNTGPNSWTQTGRADLVYANPGYGWTYTTCPVTSIGSGTISVANPCFNAGNDITNMGLPTGVENNYALLSTPGQFYVDTSASVVYYIPRPNENLSTATVVGAGNTKLLTLTNTSNLTVAGITFAYATWLMDSKGAVLSQGATQMLSDNVLDEGMLPANVACSACNNVIFNRNVFTHLGGSGLSLDGGGTQNTVTGNTIVDISGNGIELGTSYNTSTSNNQPTAYEDQTTISDNYLFNIANEWTCAVGIFAGWVKNTTIDHNDIGDISYSGISLGWGGGAHGPSYMVNNHADYNYVHDVMYGAPNDGANIYTNGTENQTPGSSIIGNYLINADSNGNGIGLDNGSSYYDVENNVIDGYAPTWLGINTGYVSATNNLVQNNYIGPHVGGGDGSGGGNVVQNNTVYSSPIPAAAKSIIAAAGLESSYVNLAPNGGPRNVAYGRSASSSSSFSSGTAAAAAVDGTELSIWASAVGDTSAWWQTDLGASRTLAKIEVMFRKDVDYPSERRNINILVSNDPSRTTGYSIACQVGSVPLPFRSRLDCPVPAGSWRYISIVKTDTSGIAVAEVHAFGTGPSFPNLPNVAAGKVPTFDSSATVQDTSYATDGYYEDSGKYTGITNGGVHWMQLDLGTMYSVSELMVWHYYADGRTYHDVIMQLSNDPTFSSGVTTVFNNDTNNSAGQGTGTDAEYAETSAGKDVAFNPVSARYVRLYTNGSTTNVYGHYVEVLVFATPPINVALGKTPTFDSSAGPQNVAYATDGAYADSSQYTGFTNGGVHWMQLDLGGRYNVSELRVWHYYADGRTYHDVIMQLSNDPTFSSGVTTVFNNDTNNSAGQGTGTDAEYAETSAGKDVMFSPVTARYVRLYTNGSTTNVYGHYVEAQVFALPLPDLALHTTPTFDSSAGPQNAVYATDGAYADSSQYTGFTNGGVHWMQLDLGSSHNVSELRVWHYYADGRTYHDVIMQLSNDSTFSSGVTTVFNNDTNNSAGQGTGTDVEYAETSAGKDVIFSPVSARYVRLYTNGSTTNVYGHYVEAQVYGL